MRDRRRRPVCVAATHDGAGWPRSVGHRVEPGHRVGVRLVDALVGVVPVDRVGDQQDRAVVVVEHREVGGQQHAPARAARRSSVACVRQPLEPAHDVVAEVADQPAGERRQAGQRAACAARASVSRTAASGSPPGRAARPAGCPVQSAPPSRSVSVARSARRRRSSATTPGRARPTRAGTCPAGRRRACGRRRPGSRRRRAAVRVTGIDPALAAPGRGTPARSGTVAPVRHGRTRRSRRPVRPPPPAAGAASKQVRSPVWQAAPSWSTLTSTVSPSQSSATSLTHCRWPTSRPSPSTPGGCGDQYVRPAGGEGAVQRLVVHPADHQHLAGVVLLDHGGHQAVRRRA